MRAEDITTTGLITTRPAASVHEATRLIVDHRVAALPVLNEQAELVGVVSELELLRHRIRPTRGPTCARCPRQTARRGTPSLT